MEAAPLPPLPAAVSAALSARSVTLTATCESTARALPTIRPGDLLSYAAVAAPAGHPGPAPDPPPPGWHAYGQTGQGTRRTAPGRPDRRNP